MHIIVVNNKVDIVSKLENLGFEYTAIDLEDSNFVIRGNQYRKFHLNDLFADILIITMIVICLLIFLLWR